MSLYGALFTGVATLSANSRALGISSNNIANVNTVGYKASTAQFETFLSRDTPAGQFSSGGVRTNTQQLVTTQGLVQNTTSETDLAVNGQGFFAVTRKPDGSTGNEGLLFTRAGSFTPDADGNLQNSQGFYLMGWQLGTDESMPADTTSLGPIDLGGLAGTAEATSSVSLRANLQASVPPVSGYIPGSVAAGSQTPTLQRTLEIIDSQGGVQPVRLAFVKTEANTWQYEVIYSGNADGIGGTGNNPIAVGTLKFDANGLLVSPSGETDVTIPWAPNSGLEPQTFALSFGVAGDPGGVTQFDTASAIGSTTSDGAAPGRLTAVSVDDDGYVTAAFDNGSQRRVYRLPLATFTNPDGLTALSSNVYRASEQSGPATYLEANVGGAGGISSGTLEASTVDLAKEFTDMITTQRAYSAGTRIITTADSMLQELISIKR